MADYRVICTWQEPASQSTTHAHIVKVGTGPTAQEYTLTWTVAEVIQAIRAGHRFYTVSPSTGKTALVQVINCTRCQRPTIRSAPDAVTDNNLDSLPRCG